MRAYSRAVMAVLLFIPCLGLAAQLKVPDLSDSRMSIPWTDFKKLLEMIQPGATVQKPPEPEPPLPFAVTSADLNGKVVSGAAAFDLTLKFTVLDKKEWQAVPVMPEAAAVSDMKLDNAPAVADTADGWTRVVLLAPGPHTLTGRVFVPLHNELGPRSITLPLPQAAVTTLTLAIPEPDLDIKAEPANVNLMKYDSGASILQAVLAPAASVTVSWGKKVAGAEAELRVNASVESLVSLGEKLCSVDSVVNYEILHRGVTGFKLKLPADASVVDVTGTGLADWKAEKDSGTQTVTVNLSYEAKGSYMLNVAYEIQLADATSTVAVPVLEAVGVNRESGSIGVAARTNIEVEVKKADNLASLDVAQLPAGIAARSAAPLLFAFKYVGHPWSLTLQATKHQDVEVLTCAVDRADLVSFLTKEGQLVTRASYVIRNNREQFIRLTLPPGARVFSTFRDGQPVQPSKDDKGRILIPLEKSAGGSGQARAFTVEITYLTQLPKLSRWFGSLDLKAPAADLMTDSMTWFLYLPQDFKYRVRKASVEPSQPTDWIRIVNGAAYNTHGNEVDIINGGTLYSAFDDGQMKYDSGAPANAPQIGGKGKYIQGRGPTEIAGSELGMMYVPNSAQPGPAQNARRDQIVQASLPVRFAVPMAGKSMVFMKDIVMQDQANYVTLGYRKALAAVSSVRRVLRITVVVVLLLLIVWYWRRRSRRKKELQAFRPEGVAP